MIDPKKFEALKKAVAKAAARVEEARCKARAAGEEYQSAEEDWRKAQEVLSAYWRECVEATH